MKMVVIMINYIKGTVTIIGANYIVIEANNIGYTNDIYTIPYYLVSFLFN